jgi:hypothetical protein
MKLQYLEIHYLASKLFDPNDEDSWYFEVKAKDIENEYNSGNEFYFVYYNTRPQDSEIYQYIKNDIENGVINVSEIKFREPPFTLTQKKQFKINEINTEKNNLLNNGNVKFKDDVFDIDDTSLLRISGTIQDWKDQIDNSLDESGIIQKWISQTNTVHDLTYSELIELARNMRLRVQSIVFYANVLKTQVSQCSTLEEVDNIKWTFE